MQNFIIFFDEKVGSSAIVSMLNNFDKIDVLHQIDNEGWEPFDKHNSGDISAEDLRACMRLIFDDSADHMTALNRIYTKTATRPLEAFRKDNSRCFKMRPWRFWRELPGILKENEIAAVILLRTDLLRWALSHYHGDGTGKKGHIQFKLASGDMSRSEIQPFHADLLRLERIITSKRMSNDEMIDLYLRMKENNIKAKFITYEEFMENRYKFFANLLSFAGYDVDPNELSVALDRKIPFEKVHSEDIATFVKNADEVLKKFGATNYNLGRNMAKRLLVSKIPGSVKKLAGLVRQTTPFA